VSNPENIYGHSHNHENGLTAGLQNHKIFQSKLLRITQTASILRYSADTMTLFLLQVTGFPDTYRMLKLDHPHLHKRAFPRLTERLARDARVRLILILELPGKYNEIC
jgi:hypothetical protein